MLLIISSSERAVEVMRIVEKSIRESRAVDTEALCIIPGEKVHFSQLIPLCVHRTHRSAAFI
jgi:hypothetical protein